MKEDGPGEYACEQHTDVRMIMYVGPLAINCRCGAPMKKVRELNAEERAELRAEQRRAAREEAAFLGQTG